MVELVFGKLVTGLYVTMTTGYYLTQMMLTFLFFVPLYLFAQTGSLYYKVKLRKCRLN